MQPDITCIREILSCLSGLRLQTVEHSPAAFGQFLQLPENLPIKKLFSGSDEKKALQQLEPGHLCELRCFLNLCYLGFHR